MTTRRYESFDDPRIAEAWAEALQGAPTSSVFQQFDYQRAWWRALGRGDLLVLEDRSEGRPVVLPLFVTGQMAFLTGKLKIKGDMSLVIKLQSLMGG